MDQLNDLKKISDAGLFSLKADESLRYRIIREANGSAKRKTQQRKIWYVVPAAAAAVIVLCLAILPMSQSKNMDEGTIITVAAGSGDSVNMTGSSGVRDGSVKAGSVPGYNSIWESGSGSNFPMIGIDGQYYRLLKEPASASSSLLSSGLGSVTEYTEEPALIGAGSVVSNICPTGTAIYEVNGMGGTVIAADVNGSTRLFQRVSFNGSALKGGEKLADTLQISGKVTKLVLSDVGTVTDSGTINDLVSILLSKASYESSGTVKAEQTLLITLKNGITLQMAVKDDFVSACGTWSCPEFFQAFAAAVQ